MTAISATLSKIKIKTKNNQQFLELGQVMLFIFVSAIEPQKRIETRVVCESKGAATSKDPPDPGNETLVRLVYHPMPCHPFA